MRGCPADAWHTTARLADPASYAAYCRLRSAHGRLRSWYAERGYRWQVGAALPAAKREELATLWRALDAAIVEVYSVPAAGLLSLIE